MANTTGSDRIQTTPWTTDRHLKINAAIPGASTTFYSGQAVGRDAAGNMVQMDDTAKAEFIGFLEDIIRTTVQTDDSVGDKVFLCDQPQMYTAKIASASAGHEGRRVYWLYNNEVSYSPGSCGNFAGWVWHVKDSTHVAVIPPWLGCYSAGEYRGTFSANAATTTTLTKFDINKVILLPLTSSATIVLPAVASVSPGDRLLFVNTSANSSVPTLDGSGAETINGQATYAMSASQYSTAELVMTGSGWVVDVPSVTLGGTTFTGDVALSSGANLVFSGTTGQSEINLTDNLADALSINIPAGNDLMIFTTTDAGEKVTIPAGLVQGSNATDRVLVKGIYMSPANVVVAVPTIADAESDEVAVDVSGAFSMAPAVGDAVIAIPQEALPTDALLQGAYVSATDTITVCFGTKEGGAGVTGANKNFKFLVLDLT